MLPTFVCLSCEFGGLLSVFEREHFDVDLGFPRRIADRFAGSFATWITPLHYNKDGWEKIPRTYVQCTAPRHPALAESQAKLRANPKWKWIEFPSGQDAMVSHPVELARVPESA